MKRSGGRLSSTHRQRLFFCVVSDYCDVISFVVYFADIFDGNEKVHFRIRDRVHLTFALILLGWIQRSDLCLLLWSEGCSNSLLGERRRNGFPGCGK